MVRLSCDLVVNQLQWIAEPGTAPLRDLWAGRLHLMQSWQSVPHAGAETALLFMAGAAHVTVKSPDSVSRWYNYDMGVTERTIYDWPRGDLIIVPPAWGIHVIPLVDAVEMLVFQSWLAEDKRDGLPQFIRGQEAEIQRHSSTCLSRIYQAGRRLHVGTTEHADGYGSFPFHSDGWRGEEIRHYLVEPKGGEAVQRLHGQYVTGTQIDAAVVVRPGDACVLPYGDTQPLLRGPNSAVFYTWAWIGQEQEGVPDV